jgi:protein-disulfide isomerase
VTLIEFSDFQCPFCATLSQTIRSMQERDPSAFRVVYRHYPLAQHTHAATAGVAAECAAQQRRFGEYHDALFANQDSIGTRAWTRFAADAGVADTVAFKRCMAGPAAKARVDEDARAAARLRLPGTPSLIVNGRLYSGGISEEELSTLISASR